jgi:ABC-2 type transport system permease protein
MLAREWFFFRKSTIFWIVLAATWLSLGLGAWNGYNRWSSDAVQAQSLSQQFEAGLARARTRLVEIQHALASGNAHAITTQELAWGPQQAQWVDAYNPPTAVLPVAPLAFLATGRSDTLPHAYASSVWRGVEPNAPTTDDPVALLIGDFDLKFVVLAILPLVLVLSGFDLLASEREDGTLRLLLSQPVSFTSVLLCRATVRGALVAGSLLVTITALAAAVHVSGGAIWIGRLAVYAVASIAYLWLWVVLSIAVNLLGRSATANAAWLGACWVAMIVFIPGITPVMAEVLAPTPSRARYIDAERTARLSVYNDAGDQANIQRHHEKLLEGFFARHPQWASDPSLVRARLLNAAQGETHSAMLAAITTDFDTARDRQQKVIAWLSLLSVTAATDRILTGLSGNSDARQAAFLAQSRDFFAASKRYFWPLIFRWDMFKPEQFADIPRFAFAEPGTQAVLRPLWLPGSGLALWLAGTLFVTRRQLRRQPAL